MKIRSIIIPSVIGTFLSAVGLAVISANEGLPGEIGFVAMALAIAFGGFVAAYLATKDEKHRLEKGLLAGMITGVFSELIIIVLMLVDVVQNTSALEQAMLMPELLQVAVIGIISMAMISGIGAIICVWLLGIGKSRLKDVFVGAWKKVHAEKEIAMGAFVLLAIPTIIEFVVQSDMLSITKTSFDSLPILGIAGPTTVGAWVSIAAYVLATLFVYNGILQAYKKRQKSAVKFLKTSISTCIPLAKAIVLSFIPAVLLIVGISLVPGLLMLSESDSILIGVLVAVVPILIAIGYGVAIMYLGQEVVLKNKGVLEAIKGSARFVRRNFWDVVLVGLLFFIVLLPLELFAGIVELFSAELTGLTAFFIGYIGMVYGITVQTQFYKEYSGKK